jgi:hypothetical protein
MPSMIHIIGVAHRVQAKPKGEADTAEQVAYRQALGNAIKQINPVVVGEEYNETALGDRKKATGLEHESITKEVANALHQFCDPDPTERKSMGYVEGGALAQKYAMDDVPDYNTRGFAEEVVKYWPGREQFWADKLKAFQDKDAVFVCGDAHVESFQKTLDKNGLLSTVHSRRIGINQQDDDWWSGIEAYRKAHPELKP